MEVGHSVSQIFSHGGKATEAVFAMRGGQMRRQIGPGQVVGHQKESASQFPFGSSSRVANPHDAAVAGIAQTAEFVKQARDG